MLRYKNNDWNLNQDTYDIDEIESATADFYNKINAALDITHPLKKLDRSLIRPNCCQSGEIKELRKKVKAAHEKWRKNKTKSDSTILHDKLKESRKELRKAIRKKQQATWKTFVSGIASFEDVAAFKKILNRQSLN